jgi:hypothetical protein
MNERANELIKSIPDLKYDASTGMFETDRRALYDLVELTIRECAGVVADAVDHREPASTYVSKIKEHFGVEE